MLISAQQQIVNYLSNQTFIIKKITKPQFFFSRRGIKLGLLRQEPATKTTLPLWKLYHELCVIASPR